MTPAEEFKAIRKRLGMTQADFGIAIGFAPTSAQVSVARIETGMRNPSGTTMHAARALLLIEQGGVV